MVEGLLARGRSACSRAAIVSWTRDFTPSLRNTARRCVFTVLGETHGSIAAAESTGESHADSSAAGAKDAA